METKKRARLSDSNDLELGLRLKYLRESHGLTVQEVAKGTEMILQTYHKYETSMTMPTARVLRRFCKFYDVTADYIIGLVDYPLPITRPLPRHVEGGDDGMEGRDGKKEGA